MNRVLVVSTVHQETGLANAAALQAYLEHIRPEVIFLELSSAGLDRFLDAADGPVESTAASRYRAIHPVTLVPVDIPVPGGDFRQSINYLFERVMDASPEYCRLRYLHGQYVSAHGFPYLNSASSATLWSAIEKAMRAAIETLGDPKLAELYGLWTNANARRETGMMNSIVDHATQNPFNTGVFLVGLAHQQSIRQKSRLGRGEGLPTVQWDFEGLVDESRKE